MAQPPVGVLGVAAEDQQQAAAGRGGAAQGTDEANPVGRGQLQALVAWSDARGLDGGETPAGEDHPVLLPPQQPDHGRPAADQGHRERGAGDQHGPGSQIGVGSDLGRQPLAQVADAAIQRPLPAADQIPGTRLRHGQREGLDQAAGTQVGGGDEVRDQRHALAVDRGLERQEVTVEQEAAMAGKLAYPRRVEPQRPVALRGVDAEQTVVHQLGRLAQADAALDQGRGSRRRSGGSETAASRSGPAPAAARDRSCRRRHCRRRRPSCGGWCSGAAAARGWPPRSDAAAEGASARPR